MMPIDPTDCYGHEPTLHEHFAAAIDDAESVDIAEAIVDAIDKLDNAISLQSDRKGSRRDIYLLLVSAREALLDIIESGGFDPRRDGWVDDRGRP